MNRQEIVNHALEIAEEYRADKLTLTLRQMYYQYVARGLLDSGQKVYKRIGAALTDARYDGRFPIHYLEDRGRSVDAGNYGTNNESVDFALDNAAADLRSAPNDWLWRSRWWGQETHVSVWVEKEALVGIFEPVCKELGVGWFACKGYPSVSALNQWLRHLETAVDQQDDIRNAVVLYFGDHDPDGWEIPRSALRNIRKLQNLPRQIDAYVPVAFDRVALNMDQIGQYNPPPFGAKETSARYESYLAEHNTDDAWELDALEPRVLRQLIRDRVAQHFDEATLIGNEETIEERREVMRMRMREDGWTATALEDE